VDGLFTQSFVTDLEQRERLVFLTSFRWFLSCQHPWKG
jgi:hypothetical protein